MKDEIIDNIKADLLYCYEDSYSTKEEYEKELDYITNLKKEIRINNDLIPYFKNKEKNLKKSIINLQEENERLKDKIKQYEDPEDLTLFYMWLDEKAKDKMKQLQEENQNLKQINEEHRKLNGELREENERLKEENKHIFANVNDDQLLRSNAMNYAEAQDYKTRNEKAVDLIIEKIDYDDEYPGYMQMLEVDYNDLLEILQGKSDE